MNARLLVTYDCHRSCALCCNKDASGPKPAVTTLKALVKYETILITGGEPLLYPYRLLDLIHDLKRITKAKIIVYTAMAENHEHLEAFIRAADGITLTLHTQEDATNFHGFSHRDLPRGKSNRLNIFEGVRPLVPAGGHRSAQEEQER